MLNEWIDVKVQLPDDGQKVLCFEDYRPLPCKSNYYGYELYYFRKEFGFVYNPDDEDGHGGITHWSKLIEPHQSEENYGRHAS